jgi:dihydroflavonol-4-reductase
MHSPVRAKDRNTMYLVTGGTGLIGSHLLYELVMQGKPVRALKRPASDPGHVKKTFSYYSADSDKLFSRIDWVDGDILDLESLNQALKGVDLVYHCAAIVSFTPRQKQLMMENNVSGTANVVNACLEREIKKLCFVSSTAAIGYPPAGEKAEEKVVWKYSKRRSSYSVSKYRSEMEVWRGEAEGLHTVIVNPSIVIGPGDWNRSSSRIFETIWNGLNFYTHGMTGYVDVWDVVSSMITLMDSNISGERFILSSENLTFREIFNLVSESLNKKPPKFYAHPYLTNLAWRLDWLISRLLFRSQTITKETARSAHNKALFSNRKIMELTGIIFKPVRQSIFETAKIFLDEHNI